MTVQSTRSIIPPRSPGLVLTVRARRLVAAILVLVVALGSTAGSTLAQTATPTADQLPSWAGISDFPAAAADLGDGWTLSQAYRGISDAYGVFRVVREFAGPAGARVSITVLNLPTPLSQRAELWDELREVWQSWASFIKDPENSAEDRATANPISISQFPLPPGVNDGLRFFGRSPQWSMIPMAVGLYALDAGPAVFIRLEGAVDGRSKLEGLDFLAGLVAAKIPEH